MIDPVVLVLLCLAVAGMTRALVIEKPFGWWRTLIRDWNGVGGNITYLVHCPFCTGFWVGVAATWMNYFHHANPVWLAFLTVWAIFAVAPHIADR